MVVFTCNNCSESVQKPRVTKHISYECKRRNARVSLCCIDCLKDFDSTTYVDHTKCLTELERYSGSNFIPKPSSNKGERKQNSWISIVRSVLNQSCLSQAQKELLQAISHFENVPRKKVKFQNFIKSSLRSLRISSNVVETVFELLEKEFKNSAASNSGNTNCDEVKKRDSCIEEDNRAQVFSDDNDEKKCCVEESVKKPREVDENEDMQTVKKKKKKNKEKSVEDNFALGNGNPGIILNKNQTKKRKLETPTNTKTVCDVNDPPGDIDDDRQVVKKKKKKKFDDSGNQEYENGTQRSIEDVSLQKENKEVLKSMNEKYIVLDENGSEENTGKKVAVRRKNKKQKNGTTNETRNEDECNEKLAVDAVENNKPNFGTRFDTEKNITGDKTVPNEIGTKECHSCESVPKQKFESVSELSHENSGNGEDSTSRFDWKAILISILQKSKNHELSLKKMKKKIAKEYAQLYQEEKPFENIIKKFDKRVKKIVNVEVSDERIRLLV